MKFHLTGKSGAAIVLLVLFVPAIAVAYHSKSIGWLAFIPPVILGLTFIVAALPMKRKVSPEEFANELESHLLGTGGRWDWDDTTSIAVADPRLERLRWDLAKFDRLWNEKDRDELRAIIESLRRGVVPEVTIPVEPRKRGLLR